MGSGRIWCSLAVVVGSFSSFAAGGRIVPVGEVLYDTVERRNVPSRTAHLVEQPDGGWMLEYTTFEGKSVDLRLPTSTAQELTRWLARRPYIGVSATSGEPSHPVGAARFTGTIGSIFVDRNYWSGDVTTLDLRGNFELLKFDPKNPRQPLRESHTTRMLLYHYDSGNGPAIPGKGWTTSSTPTFDFATAAKESSKEAARGGELVATFDTSTASQHYIVFGNGKLAPVQVLGYQGDDALFTLPGHFEAVRRDSERLPRYREFEGLKVYRVPKGFLRRQNSGVAAMAFRMSHGVFRENHLDEEEVTLARTLDESIEMRVLKALPKAGEPFGRSLLGLFDDGPCDGAMPAFLPPQ